MILGYIVGKNDKSEAGATSSSAPVADTQKSVPQKEVFTTSAKQLFKAYEENEVATDENMKGKLISVNGVVQSIDKDFTAFPAYSTKYPVAPPVVILAII